MKRLYKSRTNKVIDGVCGGIAEYFNVDAVLVRVLFVIMAFMGGSAVLAYIVAMIIVPREPVSSTISNPMPSEEIGGVSTADVSKRSEDDNATSQGALIFGIILVLIGVFALLGNFHVFDGLFWWFRHHFWHYIIPAMIIAAGVGLIIKGNRKDNN